MKGLLTSRGRVRRRVVDGDAKVIMCAQLLKFSDVVHGRSTTGTAWHVAGVLRVLGLGLLRLAVTVSVGRGGLLGLLHEAGRRYVVPAVCVTMENAVFQGLAALLLELFDVHNGLVLLKFPHHAYRQQ